MGYSQADKRNFPRPRKIVASKHMRATWQNSRDATGRGGASGVDNISPKQYRENLETNFKKLSDRLLSNDYTFHKLKPRFIQKDENKFRVICVPTVEDRFVQRLILRALTWDNTHDREKDRLKISTSISFGVGKGKDQGTHGAIKQALIFRNAHPWILKTDISKFFDRIPRTMLKKILRSRLKNSSLLPLIEAAVDCEIHQTDHETSQRIQNSGIKTGEGLRQGMPLSPLLSNLVLNGFDRKIEKSGLRIIRYADDLICFGDTYDECNAALIFLEKELHKLELMVPKLEDCSKTEIKNPDQAVIFLGVEIYKQKRQYAIKIPNKTWEEGRKRIKNLSNLKSNLAEGYTYADVLKRLEDVPNGYESAFKDCSNIRDFLILLKSDSEEVKRCLIKNIFGTEVFNKLTSDQKEFLGFPE